MNTLKSIASFARILAGAGTVLSLISLPAVAQPAGTYVRSLEGGVSAARRCAEAAGQADLLRGVAVCTSALEAGGLDVHSRAATLTNRALLQRRAGNLTEAVADCEQALDLNSAGPSMAVTCGAVYLDAGQPQAAIDLLTGSELPTPGLRYRYYHNLALAYHDMGAYAEAYDYLNKTLEAKPGFAPAVELKAQYREVQE